MFLLFYWSDGALLAKPEDLPLCVIGLLLHAIKLPLPLPLLSTGFHIMSCFTSLACTIKDLKKFYSIPSCLSNVACIYLLHHR